MPSTAPGTRRYGQRGARAPTTMVWWILMMLFLAAPLPTSARRGAGSRTGNDDDDDAGAGRHGRKEEEEEGRGAGVIANWRQQKHLSPCFGCSPGRPMALSNMFEECSLLTLGQTMGIAPGYTNLTVHTNQSVMVHLVGSRLFFPEAEALYGFLTDTLNGTCPDGNRLDNITSVCTWGGARGEGTQPALCTIYNATATKVQGDGEGEEEEEEEEDELPAHGLYGPGKYHFRFTEFNNSVFPFAFWVVQYLHVGPPDDDGRSANVSVKGVFQNNPPRVPPAKLYTGFFVAAVVLCAAFFLVYNPYVGNRAVDLGARVPWLRRNVLEQGHHGPTPQPPPAVFMRRHASSTLFGSGGWGRRVHLRSMPPPRNGVDEEDAAYHLLEAEAEQE